MFVHPNLELDIGQSREVNFQAKILCMEANLFHTLFRLDLYTFVLTVNDVDLSTS